VFPPILKCKHGKVVVGLYSKGFGGFGASNAVDEGDYRVCEIEMG
jgi:hypothetical protein